MVVEWMTRRYREVCVQPWCNPLWLTGLKAPTNWLFFELHTTEKQTINYLVSVGCGSWRKEKGWKSCTVLFSFPDLSTWHQSQHSADFHPLAAHCCPVRPHWFTFTWWGCCNLFLWHNPTELAHSFSLCSRVCFCLYGPFNCISFHKFSRQLSSFSLCSSGLISVLLVLSTVYLFMEVSLSPDLILCGWLGLKHQLDS